MPTKLKEPREAKGAYNTWDSLLLIDFYVYAKAGLSDLAIAKAMSLNRGTLNYWLKRRPEVRKAILRGREQAPDEESFTRFFYEQLDSPLQELWDRLVTNEYIGGGIVNIRKILADQGTGARQALFLHALVNSHFNPNRAMERVGLDKRTLDQWTESDPSFAELVEQVQWLKGNFFEEGLVKLCELGHPGAILFANRTFNNKRGYGNSVNINGTVDVNIENRLVLDLSELDLDLDTRTKIAAAVRAREERLAEQRRLNNRPLEERLITQVSDQIAERVNAISSES